MKNPYKNSLLLLATGLIAVSCSLVGPNPKPLSGVESSFFDRTTNYIPQIVSVPFTNTEGTVVTNTIVVEKEIYTVAPSQETKEAAATIGSLTNLVVPGVEGIVTTAILALLSGWGYLRSTKLGKTSAALSQEIETMLRFVSTLPNGAAYKQTLVKFLQDHQLETGVLTDVLHLLETKVNNNDAKLTAAEINAQLEELLKQTGVKKV